jgi:transposase-like protein/IS1 family transposase
LRIFEDTRKIYVLAAKGQVPSCHCCSGPVKKCGRFQNKNGVVQRFKCCRCAKSFSEVQPLPGIRLERDKAVQIVERISETVGIRAAGRLARVDEDTVLRILESAGEHCARLLDARIRNVSVPYVQADEVYSYVQHLPGDGVEEHDPKRGAFYVFLAIAKDEKLIINYRVSKRTGDDASEFLEDLRNRMACRFQFTTDGFRGYCATNGSRGNVENILGDCCDYATETKIMKKDPDYTGARRFFAPYLVKIIRRPRFGNPDMSLATTCHAERTNLTLRTFNRRLVRRTINFSKTVENHRNSVALFVAVFNFCRVHKTLKKTPAMAAGLTDHVWTVEELLSTKD